MVDNTMNKESGLTLIEILVTCSVLGILAAIAIPGYMSMMPSLRLNGATRMLAGDLMAARMSAVKENNRYKIFLDAPPSYTILNDEDEDGSADSGDEFTIKNIQNEYSDVSFNVSRDYLYFYSKGTASGTTITLQNSSGSKEITINLIGRVKID